MDKYFITYDISIQSGTSQFLSTRLKNLLFFRSILIRVVQIKVCSFYLKQTSVMLRGQGVAGFNTSQVMVPINTI